MKNFGFSGKKLFKNLSTKRQVTFWVSPVGQFGIDTGWFYSVLSKAAIGIFSSRKCFNLSIIVYLQRGIAREEILLDINKSIALL